MRDVLEVHNTSVVVVLAREDDFVEIGWMGIGNAVLVSVPAAVAEIETAHESDMTIDEAKLLVVGPVEHLAVRDTIDALQGISYGSVSVLQASSPLRYTNLAAGLAWLGSNLLA